MQRHRLQSLVVALVATGCGVGIVWFVTRDTPLPSRSNRLVVYETKLGREGVYAEGFPVVPRCHGGRRREHDRHCPPNRRAGVRQTAGARPLHHQELVEAG